jgi:hypothetical protein
MMYVVCASSALLSLLDERCVWLLMERRWGWRALVALLPSATPTPIPSMSWVRCLC